MEAILDFKELDKKIYEKWAHISLAKPDNKLKAMVDYMVFLLEQYDKGVLGYVAFPFYITSLFTLNSREYEENKNFAAIIDLAANLELPDNKIVIMREVRLATTEKLSQMIRGLAKIYS